MAGLAHTSNYGPRCVYAAHQLKVLIFFYLPCRLLQAGRTNACYATVSSGPRHGSFEVRLVRTTSAWRAAIFIAVPAYGPCGPRESSGAVSVAKR